MVTRCASACPMGFLDDTLRGLKRLADSQYGGPTPMAERLGANPPTVSRWINKERAPSLDKLGPILDALGAKIVFPDEQHDTMREVHFVNPRKVRAGEHVKHDPVPDNYRAVPLVTGDVAAGPGLLPEDDVKSWVLVYVGEDGIQGRSNLVAVRVGRGQTSMTPTIQPGDIVLVDMDDNTGREKGKIHLVRDPHEGVAVKRVKRFVRKERELVTFYSDNAEEFPPDTYSIATDFEGDIGKAIVGRVVWAWSDMTRK